MLFDPNPSLSNFLFREGSPLPFVFLLFQIEEKIKGRNDPQKIEQPRKSQKSRTQKKKGSAPNRENKRKKRPTKNRRTQKKVKNEEPRKNGSTPNRGENKRKKN
jgi:hypothetical protein